MTSAQVSLAELIRAGITPDADAAVAIARAIIVERSSSPARSSATTHEPPLPENIYLASDGTVVWGNGETPAVSDVALFLRQLLPIGDAATPGGLHYAIARALLEVDAPPFESVEDFSCALARFERGDREQLLRGLIEKAQTGVMPPRAPAERRRTTSTSFSDLRRALQEADSKLFQQQMALDAMAAARPPQKWNRLAVAACIGAAAAGGGAGYVLHGQLAIPPSTLSAHSASMLGVPPTHTPPAADIVLAAPARRPVHKLAGGAPMRAPMKAAVRRTSDAQPPNQNGGIFKRLRLQWLRKAFTGRT